MCASKNPSRSQKGLGLYSGARIKDALDQLSLDFIEERSFDGELPHVLELGSGAGTHTVRMSQMGACVTAVDLDSAQLIDLLKRVALHKLIDLDHVKVVEKNWLDLSVEDIHSPVDMLFSQRSLSYLSYVDLKKLLGFVGSFLKEGAVFMVSLNGIDSLYGADHPLRDCSVVDRFGLLSEKMQDVLNATQPVCVYKEDEVSGIFHNTGYMVESIKKTPFGNFQVKGVFNKLNE